MEPPVSYPAPLLELHRVPLKDMLWQRGRGLHRAIQRKRLHELEDEQSEAPRNENHVIAGLDFDEDGMKRSLHSFDSMMDERASSGRKDEASLDEIEHREHAQRARTWWEG